LSSGRQRSRRTAAQRGGKEDRAGSGVQPFGLPVGKRLEDHRVRRHHSVHETARAEVRGRGAAAVRRSGRERRARGQRLGTRCGVNPTQSVRPCTRTGNVDSPPDPKPDGKKPLRNRPQQHTIIINNNYYQLIPFGTRRHS